MDYSQIELRLIAHIADEKSMIRAFNEELDIEYYKKALEVMSQKVNDFEYSIFTDDIKWVKNQQLFNDAKLIHTSPDEPNEVVKTFSLMLKNYLIIFIKSLIK